MFDHILAPLDGSSLAECVLPHVVAVARACESQVTLMHVLEQSQDQGRLIDPLSWHINEAETRAYLDGLTPRLQQAGLRTGVSLLDGQAAGRIIGFAHSQDVDLIVLSSHGQSGLSGWNVSSVVQKTALRAHVPVMIVRAYQAAPADLDFSYRRILVPLDCSQRAECVLPLATALARFHGAELLMAHIVSPPQMPQRVPHTPEDIELANRLVERNWMGAADYLAQRKSWSPVDVRTHLLVSDNVPATLHNLVEQENVDLVVLSAHGCSGGTMWPYGSMALNFLCYGSTPLLIVQDLSPGKAERTMVETFDSECTRQYREYSPRPARLNSAVADGQSARVL